jgi:hypothetical protein
VQVKSNHLNICQQRFLQFTAFRNGDIPHTFFLASELARGIDAFAFPLHKEKCRQA